MAPIKIFMVGLYAKYLVFEDFGRLCNGHIPPNGLV
jgi:hypothetical protein